MMKIDKPSTKFEPLNTINEYKINFKKKFGQNFLIDKNIINKIISAIDIQPDDFILEIGPGSGSLTQFLLEYDCKICVIEIDSEMVQILNDKFSSYKNLEIINADFLKFDLQKYLSALSKKNIKVVSNLPYYISTPILTKLLESEIKINRIVAMMQKEVAQRFAAVPSTKNYGTLTLLANYYSKISTVTDVSPNCFIPKPNVTSTVLSFDILQKPAVETTSSKVLFEVIKKAFSKRRKTLLNCLDGLYDLTKQDFTDVIQENHFPLDIRGESLSLAQFALISDSVCKKLQSAKTETFN